jgi:hypothetical protein
VNVNELRAALDAYPDDMQVTILNDEYHAPMPNVEIGTRKHQGRDLLVISFT